MSPHGKKASSVSFSDFFVLFVSFVVGSRAPLEAIAGVDLCACRERHNSDRGEQFDARERAAASVVKSRSIAPAA